MKRFLLLTLAAGLLSASRVGAADNPVVVVETSKGTIKIELYPQKASDTVENFLGYVDSEFYDGTVFHSVLPDSRIAGGLFDQNLAQKPTKPPIDCEGYNGLANERGTVAMLQLRDIDDRMNITAPFFINVADNKDLDNDQNTVGSAVFGKVIEGMDVVDQIKAVKTTTRGKLKDVPARVVLIKSIRRAEK